MLSKGYQQVIDKIKLDSMPCCDCVNTTVWMHIMDGYEKKARWKLHKNGMGCSKQILEASLHKTSQPSFKHLASCKKGNACFSLY